MLSTMEKSSDISPTSPAAGGLSPTSNGPAGSKSKKLTKKISNVITKNVTSPVVHTIEKLGTVPLRHLSSPSSSVATASNHSDGASAKDTPPTNNDTSPLPPDEVLSKMKVFLKCKLRGVSVQDYYKFVWSEGDGVDPFYAPWLESCGKLKINVGSWEEATSTIVNPWDEESYDRQRIVTFTTKRSGIGPSTADATQTQRCRVVGNDRCVVSLTINMKVPFGDCFSVEVRWVVSRVGSRDISVSCGMVINFSKSCFVESKIRSNTTAETQKGQSNLWENMKRVCGSISQGDDADVEEEENEDESELRQLENANIGNVGRRQHLWLHTFWSILLTLTGWRLASYLIDYLFALFTRPKLLVDEGRRDIAEGIKEAHFKLEELLNMLRDDDINPREVDRMRAVIPIVNDALGKLIAKAKPKSK